MRVAPPGIGGGRASRRGGEKRAPGRPPGGGRPGETNPDYRRSERTADVDWLAWARAAIPDWFRMLNRVRLADSSAMFASRMRLSAARLLTICDCARLIA